MTMPKMKTHSGAKKRFKKTGTGKLMRRKQNRNHILEKKSSKLKRSLAVEGQVSAADRPRINKMLGL
jgi:large subunit ribosomal protein L35